MTIVVGVSPDESGADAVALGAVLARLMNSRLVLAYVHPPIVDYPSVGHVDAEWGAFLQERGDAALSRAADQLSRDWSISGVERVIVGQSSVGRGLREVAAAHEASVVVLGPGSGGRDEHVALGAVAHSLLHDGSAAVALAPQMYRETAPDRLERLVVGFSGTEESRSAVQVAADLVRDRDVQLVLLTVVLRSTRIPASRLGRDPERMVIDAAMEQSRAAQEAVGASIGEPLDGFIVQADTPDQAVARFAWQPSDLFVLASSGIGAVRRVFMGDTSHKLIRASTTPAIVLPRSVEDNAQQSRHVDDD